MMIDKNSPYMDSMTELVITIEKSLNTKTKYDWEVVVRYLEKMDVQFEISRSLVGCNCRIWSQSYDVNNIPDIDRMCYDFLSHMNIFCGCFK